MHEIASWYCPEVELIIHFLYFCFSDFSKEDLHLFGDGFGFPPFPPDPVG